MEEPGRFTEEPVYDAWLEPDSRRPAWEFARYDYNATWMSDEDVYRRNTHSVIQEFYLTLDYGLPGNWFAGVTTSYAFQGMTGWWFRPHVGYQAAICSDADFVLSAGMSATSSYFDNKSLFMSNGSQAWC